MNRTSIVRATLAAAIVLSTATAGASREGEWDFTVYLDDRKIGQHRFRLSRRGQDVDLVSQARFAVKILLVTVYDYEHDAREMWQGDCLRRLDSRTDDNGKKHAVNGAREADRFVVRKGAQRDTLPECVMSFAYWNPRFRDRPRLLNPQTGDYLDVRIEAAGRDRVAVRGQMVEANRYVLRGAKLEITLWYSVDEDRWLALDSPTEGGRRLRYRIE